MLILPVIVTNPLLDTTPSYSLPPMIALTGDPLQDDILQLCRESGIEDIAKEVGVIRNGEIPVLKDYSGKFMLPITHI